MSGESEYLVELKRPSDGHCKDKSQNSKFFFSYKISLICVLCIPIIIIWWHFLINMRKQLLLTISNVFIDITVFHILSHWKKVFRGNNTWSCHLWQHCLLLQNNYTLCYVHSNYNYMMTFFSLKMRKQLLLKISNVFKTVFPFFQYSGFRLTINGSMNALNWASKTQSCIN